MKKLSKIALALPLVLLTIGATAASASIDLRTLQAPDPASPTGLAGSAAPAASYPETARTPPSPELADGEAIVRFKRRASASKQRRAHLAAGAWVERKMLLPNTYLVRFKRSRDVHDVVALYNRRAAVKYAEPNFVRTYDSTFPNDPAFGELWGYHNQGQTVNGLAGTAGADIGAPQAWDVTQGSSNVVVGVVDTGIDYNHSDLAPNMWTNPSDPIGGGDQDGNGLVDDYYGYNFLEGNANPDPIDTVGHGSHVAGIVAARGNNATGTAGVSWNARIASLRVCDAVGCDDAAIADAFTYAGIKGMRIVNASISSPNDLVTPGTIYSNTVSAAMAASPNTLFVVAAGNGGADEVGDNIQTAPSYPCSYTAANLLCVTATDANDNLATFADYGSTSVDIAAPGQYILSTWKRNAGQDQYAFQSGTSQAAPMAAGAAALDLAKTPSLTTAALKSDLTSGVQPVPSLAGRVATGGRLSLDALVPAQPPPPAPTDGFDTSFNTTGKITVQFPGATITNLIDLALQSDGKVVVGGYANVGNYDFVVARLNTNGTLDTSFSGDGWATASFGAGDDYAGALAIHSDGKIVIAGSANNTDFAVARFNTNGSLDTTFSGDGLATTDTGLQDLAYAVTIQSDGKIVLAGTRQSADFSLVRYNTNGTLDTTFDGDGIVQTDMGTTNEEVHDLAVQSDGKILAVGGIFPFGPSPGDFALARYNTNGSLDTTFDGDGKVFTDWGGRADSLGESAQAVRILGDGRIVVAGQVPDATTTSLWRFAVARYLTNGSLDGTFGTGGKASQTVTGDTSPSTSADVKADDVAIAPTGEVVVVGWQYLGPQTATIVRFNGNGTVDTTFGQSGVATPSLCSAPGGQLTGVAVQPNRRIVAGQLSCAVPAANAAVARFNGSSASVSVTPDSEMNPAGQNVDLIGFRWPPNTTLTIQQCNETNPASPVCFTFATVPSDANGTFSANITGGTRPNYAGTGGSCPDPNCKVVVSAPSGEVVKEPISFRSTTSLIATPSDGGIAQGDAIKVGDAITVSANLAGGTSAPTGSVSFSWCGPLVSPATCAVGGTAMGSTSLTPGGGNTATATSSSVSFGTPGRYCFRASYAGDGTHRSATDSSKTACVAVRSAPGTGPVALDDFYSGAPGDTIIDGSPGLMQNDIFGIGSIPTAQLVTGPSNGTLQGGLNADGSFTYVPDPSVRRLSTGTSGGNGAQASTWQGNSSDGSHVFFETAESLVPADTDSSIDVYDRVGSTTTLVSTGPAGGNGAFNASFAGASPDGTHVFVITGEPLVSTDTDTSIDLYERFAGATTHVSTGPASTNAASFPTFEAVSTDGARVFFETAEKLVAADTNTLTDLYQRETGTTSLVSTGPTVGTCGTCGRGGTFVGISDDGTRAFFSSTDRMVSVDTDSLADVYERAGGVTTLVSAGTNTLAAFFRGSSSNGAHVIFDTLEPLVAGDTDNRSDIYDRFGGVTTLISTGSSGGNGAFHATENAVSDDGSRVLFSTSESLVPGDTDTSEDIYQRSGGTTTLVSTGSPGGNGAEDVTFEAASADATRVIFETLESLVPSDTDTAEDLYERFGGITTMIGPGGAIGSEQRAFSGISADATHVYLRTFEQLVPSDTDSFIDIYERASGKTTLISTGPGDVNGSQTNVFRGNSDDGTVVFFDTTQPLTADDGDPAPGYSDVYAYEPAATSDVFTYRVQDNTGTSAPAMVTIDLTGNATTDGTRYRGTRYQGTRYRGTRYRGTRYRGTRYRTLFDATLTTYAECGSRWVWVNPSITVFEQTYLEVSAALYDAAGNRIASSSGFIAQGDFFGDLGEPLAIEWPVWNSPVPAGGAYAQVFLKAVPADPNHAPYEITSNVVGCQT